ncbi:MAG: alanine--tRNA ligase [Bacteroidia bacterium]|nr:alanine--tRNA ligase [Bacteroidia bacterium]
MNSNELRNAFFEFFRQKQHQITQSAPLVVKNDPSLMFINAGMNQFKDIFLGNITAKYPRVANSQKCLRVSGKHNDLEEVGLDTYHHTMFEMLGNWSFGNYFKKDAIAWAYEFLVKVLGIPSDLLYATIFKGSPEENFDRDIEAEYCWREYMAEDHILEGTKKDNFWEMGDIGPCGPCSEIHIDLRTDAERKKIPGSELINAGNPNVIELWNLVFIQFNRKTDGSLEVLPQKHIDTGMGFERLCMVMQNKHSNYDTDIFQSIIKRIEEVSHLKYRVHRNNEKFNELQERTNIAMRVIADHIRAISFSIADGQLPSNTGAGYVIRRLLRRAVRFGFQSLNMKEPFIYQIIPSLISTMGKAYPELVNQQSLIEKVVKEEESSFYHTLASGLKRIEDYCIQKTGSSDNDSLVDGKIAFELYDTYGFPVDLTALIAKNYQLIIDEHGFTNELEAQKIRSRNATALHTGDWQILSKDAPEEFIGYNQHEAEVNITRYRKVTAKGKEYYQLVFNYTPFYAESGGQVGDTGYIASTEEKIEIIDTKRENNLIVHYTLKLPADPTAIFKAVVDKVKRENTARNHTATHLLHKTLREILGGHVEQKGSLVHPGYLRFDFSHYQKLADNEILTVEAGVNEKIRQNLPLEALSDIPIQAALNMGAVALFGEKYGEKVRVIRFGDSVELCGGIHVSATGRIGFFKIISETAIAAGIRRIEAVTSEKAEQYIAEKLESLKQIALLLKSSKNITDSVRNVLQQNDELKKNIETLEKERIKTIKTELIACATEINNVKIITQQIEIESVALLKELSFQLKSQIGNLCLILGADIKGKPNLAVTISENLVNEKGLDASIIVKAVAGEIKGGGGGQLFYATAGGSELSGLKKAVEMAAEMIKNKII